MPLQTVYNANPNKIKQHDQHKYSNCVHSRRDTVMETEPYMTQIKKYLYIGIPGLIMAACTINNQWLTYLVAILIAIVLIKPFLRITNPHFFCITQVGYNIIVCLV